LTASQLPMILVRPLISGPQMEAYRGCELLLTSMAAVRQLQTVHKVAGSAADAIGQWFNAGGMIQFYDYALDVYMNVRNFKPSLTARGGVLS